MEDNENTGFEKPNQFGLPEDYFQKSANSIMNRIEWEEEHKDFPYLKALKNINPFEVPDNYFTGIESRLELLDQQTLISIKKINPFSVPEDYFETLSYHLSEKAGIKEAERFEKLHSIRKQNNFSVDEDYFAGSEKNLNILLETSKPVRIINLVVKRVVYAAAAVLTIVMGLWIYNYYFKPVEIKDCGTIACADRIDLVKAKNLEDMDNEELYQLVNPNQLEKKLLEKEMNNKPENRNDSSLDDIPEDLLDEI